MSCSGVPCARALLSSSEYACSIFVVTSLVVPLRLVLFPVVTRPGGVAAAGLPSVQQRVGLTSAMLAESQHSADGQSDTIKIKLTATMVLRSI
jgi:hypothetical protein